MDTKDNSFRVGLTICRRHRQNVKWPSYRTDHSIAIFVVNQTIVGRVNWLFCPSLKRHVPLHIHLKESKYSRRRYETTLIIKHAHKVSLGNWFFYPPFPSHFEFQSIFDFHTSFHPSPIWCFLITDRRSISNWATWSHVHARRSSAHLLHFSFVLYLYHILSVSSSSSSSLKHWITEHWSEASGRMTTKAKTQQC